MGIKLIQLMGTLENSIFHIGTWVAGKPNDPP